MYIISSTCDYVSVLFPALEGTTFLEDQARGYDVTLALPCSCSGSLTAFNYLYFPQRCSKNKLLIVILRGSPKRTFHNCTSDASDVYHGQSRTLAT